MSETMLYRISIGGKDISNDVAPILEEIQVVDGSENEADTANVTLDDTDGHIAISKQGDPVTIELGRSSIGIGQVFQGFIDTVRSTGNRKSGRRLVIDCKSANLSSRQKEPIEKHWDDKTLGDILKEAGQAADLPDIVVDPALASIMVDYEAMDGEDLLTFGARLAREHGATFKVMGPRAVFVRRNSGRAAIGQEMPVFEARAGTRGNLLEWDISPIISRPVHSEFQARWFDFATNQWKQEVAPGTEAAKHRLGAQRPTQGLAKEASGSDKTEAERKAGEGMCRVLGSYEPQAEGRCKIAGARPGVDGVYIIENVTHNASRSSGYECTLQLAHPDGGAGTDAR